jgi:hypothetical protein
MYSGTSLTHGAEPFLRSCQLRSHSGTFQGFMVPESSLPRSQEPSTGPYPEPDRSNPYHILEPTKSKFSTNIQEFLAEIIYEYVKERQAVLVQTVKGHLLTSEA